MRWYYHLKAIRKDRRRVLWSTTTIIARFIVCRSFSIGGIWVIPYKSTSLPGVVRVILLTAHRFLCLHLQPVYEEIIRHCSAIRIMTVGCIAWPLQRDRRVMTTFLGVARNDGETPAFFVKYMDIYMYLWIFTCIYGYLWIWLGIIHPYHTVIARFTCPTWFILTGPGNDVWKRGG